LIPFIKFSTVADATMKRRLPSIRALKDTAKITLPLRGKEPLKSTTCKAAEGFEHHY
jgi:hypothetical protein